MDPVLVPTTAKVRDTFLKFEDDIHDTPASDIINSKYQGFLETLESIQDSIRHESQIRSESMSGLQKEFEKTSNEMLFNLNSYVFKHIDTVSTNLRASSERLLKIETDYNEFKRQSSINELKQLQSQLNTIRKDYIDQDKISDEITTTLEDRITQLNNTSGLVVCEQNATLSDSLDSLESKIKSAIDTLAANNTNLSNSINNDLQILTHALAKAGESRKESDSFIAAAIAEMVNLLPSEMLLSSNQVSGDAV